MTEALRSGAISNAMCVVIDNFGSLWYWNFHRYPFVTKQVGGDLPFIVSVVADNTNVYALDEHGDVWWAKIASELKFEHTEITNMRSLYITRNELDFYGLDSEGILWTLTPSSQNKTNDELPPLQMFSSAQLRAGVDLEGKVWTWTRSKPTPKMIDLHFSYAKGAFAERDIVKILSDEGQLWKFHDHDTLIEPLFHDLPPLITVSVSGGHSIALTDSGDAYGWGSNVSGELGSSGNGEFYSPQKIKEIPPINTAICGPNCSILIAKDGDLLVLRGGVKRIKEIPQAFIRKRSAKSARK